MHHPPDFAAHVLAYGPEMQALGRQGRNGVFNTLFGAKLDARTRCAGRTYTDDRH